MYRFVTYKRELEQAKELNRIYGNSLYNDATPTDMQLRDIVHNGCKAKTSEYVRDYMESHQDRTLHGALKGMQYAQRRMYPGGNLLMQHAGMKSYWADSGKLKRFPRGPRSNTTQTRSTTRC